MRVAWLTDDAPDRRHGGTGIRQSYLLEALARRHACHLYSTGGPPDPVVESLLAGCQVVPKARTWWPRARWQRRLHDLWLAGPGGPTEAYLTATARAALAGALRGSEPFDLVVVEHAGLAPLVRHRDVGRVWALTLHNVASARADQQLTLTTELLPRMRVRREIALARRLERRALQAYDLVCCVSALDASQLPGHTAVVDNGVDLEAFRVTPLPAAPRVVFTGTLSYRPNIDGLTWFVQEVWPRVRARSPEAELLLVGRLPSAEVLALDGHAGVTVHADVPDVRPYLSQARVAVVPLRMGSGTRLKALEAMAAGRPVVGTSIGLEGLRVLDSAEVLVADDPNTLADQVLTLLEDDVPATRLAQAGRAYVEAHHSWTSLGNDWVALLEETVGSES